MNIDYGTVPKAAKLFIDCPTCFDISGLPTFDISAAWELSNPNLSLYKHFQL